MLWVVTHPAHLDAFQRAAEWFALKGDGYQFWSGIGSGSPLIAGVYVLFRRHNCSVKRCPRIVVHTHPESGMPVCRRHHPAVK